ncbi:hypothetical protein NPIL_198501 [Nephila pilipes]|uniref:Uncharacterized protein n=1 Tax=Nephila pilipes TaxID=299642 RepID=A0A8X6PTU3_NEPPI|nr:hypothetical protein NPIL_198501 [Nephila pilipes]
MDDWAGLAGNFLGVLSWRPLLASERPTIDRSTLRRGKTSRTLPLDGGEACLSSAVETAAAGFSKEPSPHARQRAPVSPPSRHVVPRRTDT